MPSVKVLSAVGVVGAQLVAAQTRTNTACASDFTVTSIAQATDIGCPTLQKDLIVDSSISGSLVIGGVEEIQGSLVITNASGIDTLSSSSLTTIADDFRLEALTEIRTIELPALTDLGNVVWIHLPQLNSIRLGQSGVTSAKNVEISDTNLASLDEFKVSSVNKMVINNNARLKTYASDLGNITDELSFTSNDPELTVSLPELIWANNLVFRNVSSVDVNSLQYINDSIRFDQNSISSFSAPNLTTVEKGDVAFLNNNEATNMTFPQLTEIGGSLTLINNTKLESIDGFPKLETIGGAVRLGGSFSNVSLPSLSRAAGDFVIASTEEISSTCDYFEGKDREIDGQYACRGKDDKANNEDDVNSSGGSNGGGGSSNGDGGSGAASIAVNTLALLAVAAAGVFAL